MGFFPGVERPNRPPKALQAPRLNTESASWGALVRLARIELAASCSAGKRRGVAFGGEGSRPHRRDSNTYEANVFSVNVPDPSVVPTPFSKKQPPPKESPTSVTLLAAALNASALADLGWPFQSLHACVASTVTVSVKSPFARTALAGDTSAHQ